MDLKSRAENMREFFDEKIDTYDDHHAKYADTKLLLTTKLSEFYPEGSKIKVLDLGGGTGLELIPLYEQYPDAETTVLDISPEMLAKCGQRPFADKLTLILGDYFADDWGSDFDAVISTSSLHHYDEENKLVLYKKILACLKDGGVFINSDKTAKDLAEQESCLYDLIHEPTKYRHMDTPLCAEREAYLMKESGMKNVVVEDTPQSNYKLYSAVK